MTSDMKTSSWLGEYWDLIKSGKLTFSQANFLHEELKDKTEEEKDLVLNTYLKGGIEYERSKEDY